MKEVTGKIQESRVNVKPMELSSMYTKKYHVNLSDTDLYKITMQMAICRLYPRVKARYAFFNRDNRPFPKGFGKRLKEIIEGFRDYKLTEDERLFMLDRCYYLDPQYLDFLMGYRYDPSEVQVVQNGEELKVEIEGYWYRTVLWEVPLMATISERYFEMTGQKTDSFYNMTMRNRSKANELSIHGIKYSEFGTRRRYSFENQAKVVADLNSCGSGHMLGTSNLMLAMKYNITPMGTVAHEWYQAHAAMFGYLRGNAEASEAWVRVFEGNLGIALPDTFTTDVFYRSAFNTKFAKLFDGVRQDSGNSLEFIEKTIHHYNKLRIRPCLKTILFSDNLKSIQQIKEIHDACQRQNPENRILDRYGIGTWFSNDVGVKPLNIVIKLVGLDFGEGWRNTVKLSDSKTKHTGNNQEIQLCLQTLGLY